MLIAAEPDLNFGTRAEVRADPVPEHADSNSNTKDLLSLDFESALLSHRPFDLERPLSFRWPAGISPRRTLYGLAAFLIPQVSGQDDLVAANCSLDQGNAKPGNAFNFPNWVERGHCIRNGNYAQCRVNLIAALDSQDAIHSSEYSASASILALLPTIGALFGSPTSEIWTLLTILPFGGTLAMFMSFGGTMMPTRVMDYQGAVSKNSIWIGNAEKYDQPENEFEEEDLDLEREEEEQRLRRRKIDLLTGKIQARIGRKEKLGIPRRTVAVCLLAMVLLFCGVQVAIGIVEYGAVYSDGCTYNWWFHVWYLAVTVSTMLENWAQLPFRKHWKLYLTGIPYQYEVTGGEPITRDFASGSFHSPEQALGVALKQLKTITPGSVSIVGSNLDTQPRNAMLVLISVARKSTDLTTRRQMFQVLTKATSITVFVFGTCVLSAVTLLAMPMAQLVLMLVLAGGVGSRVIAGAIVTSATKNEPLIHVITENEEEAFKVMTEIFDLQNQGDTKFQLEIQGHIFVEGRRVAKRSLWFRRILGVIASPFDLRKAKKHAVKTAAEELPLQNKYDSTTGSGRSVVYDGHDTTTAPQTTYAAPFTGTSGTYKGAPQVELRRMQNSEFMGSSAPPQRKYAPAPTDTYGEVSNVELRNVQPYEGT